MEDLKESSDVLLIMFSGNLFQSVIVLGKKDSFLYSVLQDGIYKLLVWECRVCLFCGMSLSSGGLTRDLYACSFMDTELMFKFLSRKPRVCWLS